MKKWIRILAAAACMLGMGGLLQTAAASDALQARSYSAKILLDQQELALPSEEPVLLYNGKAYVPLRQFAESAGMALRFDEPANAVYLSTAADHHTSAVIDDIIFTIRTPKQVYRENEAIPIWCSAEYIGNTPDITVWSHFNSTATKPFILSITGENDLYSTGYDDAMRSITLEKDRPAVWNSTDSITKYLRTKIGPDMEYGEFEQSIKSSGLEGRLPKGAYTIHGLVRYQLDIGAPAKEAQLELHIQVQ